MSWMEHHKLSERLASEAQVASLQGRATEARELYAQAADAEDRAFADLDRSKVRTAGISAVSAASLYYKAADLVRAEEVAATWLGVGWLPDFAEAQLRSLLQSIRTGDQTAIATASAPKAEPLALWVDSFLESRGLADPDGRQLYAYRCTAKEFEALQDALQGASTPPKDAYRFRAFVLYAAQWWQRQYDGGRWAWEPLLDSIGWSMHYPDLYPDVRRAWRWWKVKPVRLPSSTRFLGTFACHGGLPLALVGNAKAPITIYLKAVLGHSLEYRRFVEDTIELAKDKEHLLRPPTLRRDYVFRLAADLVDAVLELQPSAQKEDPITALDRDQPAWREAMPLDLDNALARDLLLGLLRDAAKGREKRGDDLSVRRFLRLTSIGWRLGARVQLPPSISALQLSRQLGVADGLPARMEVRVSAKGTHVLGIYDYHDGDGDGEYRLAGRQAQLDIWDEEAAGELRLQFLAGDYVGGGVVPKGGASLGELPWAFRSDDYECPFIGEGTVRNRAPEIVVLMPREEDGPADGARGEGDVVGRAIWRVHSAATIQTAFGTCTIHPGAQEQPADDYLLRGDRWYDAYCAYPLYKGVPSLNISKSGGLSRAVPTHEVQWRQQSGDWQQMPSKGLWQVRHVVRGELRYFRRIGILPDGIAMELEPRGAVGEGCLAFTGAETVRVATDDASIDVHEGQGGLRVNMTAANPRRPPTTVKLKLHWPGSSELHVVVPFPGRGGQFLREGELVPPMVAADDLYGVRAVALSPKPNDRFWIEGELKALDLGALGKVAHFRKPLRRVGTLHELPLIDARALVELLLSASSSSDAHVDLRIVNAAGESQCVLKVSRFAAVLEYSADNAYVELSPPPEGGGVWSFHALPMARPDEGPLTLETGDRPDSSIAALPPDLRFDEPWLAIARHDGRICARPAEISHQPRSAALMVRDAPPPRLAEAARVIAPDQRRTAVQQALQAVLDGGVDDMDEEWEFLMQMLLVTSDLPASSIDMLVGLTKIPRLLVRCLFRVDSVPRQRLWRLEHELPFSWLLVKRDVWWQESKAAFDVVREALDNAGLDDAVETARDHVSSILAEGGQSNAGLRTVGFDTTLRLAGGRLTQEFADEKQAARDAATSAQIVLRNDLEDWPLGDGRKQWTAAIGYKSVLSKLWQKLDGLGHRQPLFDTPVAAACYSLLGPEPTPRAIYLVRRMRTHDQEWFDLTYGAAWARLAVALDGVKGKT